MYQNLITQEKMIENEEIAILGVFFAYNTRYPFLQNVIMTIHCTDNITFGNKLDLAPMAYNE